MATATIHLFRTMPHRCSLALLLLLLCLTAVTRADEADDNTPSPAPSTTLRPTLDCPMGCGDNNPSLQEGYFASLQDLQCQFAQDFLPDSDRIYRLCPNTIYIVTDSVRLTPLFNNTRIACGPDGSSDGNCILARGTNQFFMTQALVELEGLTFQDNGETQDTSPQPTTSAFLAAGRVLFKDCHWRDFSNLEVLVRVGLAGASFEDCSFTNITVSDSVFKLETGALYMKDVTVENVVAGEHILRGDAFSVEMDTVGMSNIKNTAAAIQLELGSSVKMSNVQLSGFETTEELLVLEDAILMDVMISNSNVASLLKSSGEVNMTNVVMDGNLLTSAGIILLKNDAMLQGVVIRNNTFSGNLLSYQSSFPQTLSVTDSSFVDNTGGFSLASIRGTGSFSTCSMSGNKAEVAIEGYAILRFDSLEYSENTADWHIYARPGSTLELVGEESSVEKNTAVIGLLYLEQDAKMSLTNVKIADNTVKDFHLISVLEGSEFTISDSSVMGNTVASTVLFTFDSSTTTVNRVSFASNEAGGALFRATKESSLSAILVEATLNYINTTLVIADDSSTLSLSLTDLMENDVQEGVLWVNTGATAFYAGVKFLTNVGASEGIGMLRCSQESILTLSTIEVEGNTFDHVLVASDMSSVDIEDITVSSHTGVSANKDLWDTLLIEGGSILAMTNAELDSGNAVLFSDSGSQVVLDNILATGGGSMLFGTDTRSILSNICFMGGSSPMIWSTGASMLDYSDVSVTSIDTSCSIRVDEAVGFVQRDCDDSDTCTCTDPDASTCTAMGANPPTPIAAGSTPTRAPLTRPPSFGPASGAASWRMMLSVLSSLLLLGYHMGIL